METTTIQVVIPKSKFDSAEESLVHVVPFELAGSRWNLTTTIVKDLKNPLKACLSCRPFISRGGWSCDVKLVWKIPTSSVVDHCSSSWSRTLTENQYRHEAVVCQTLKFDGVDDLTVDFTVIVTSFDGITIRVQNRKTEFSEKSTLSDVVLQVGDQKFYVNKTLLAFRSPVFERMFNGEFAEKSQEEVEIKDADSKIFTEFLKIMYDQECDMSDENVSALLELSDRFDVSCVTEKCENFLRSRHTKFPLAEKFLFADKFNLKSLSLECLWEVRQNVEYVREELERASSFAELSDKMKVPIYETVLEWNQFYFS